MFTSCYSPLKKISNILSKFNVIVEWGPQIHIKFNPKRQRVARKKKNRSNNTSLYSNTLSPRVYYNINRVFDFPEIDASFS